MTEETFVRELERQARSVHAAPLTFDAVRDRAHRIRRRRQAAATGAVAAVVALALLVPTVLGGQHRSRAPEPAPAPAVAPGTSVLHDGTLTRPDGSTVDIGVDNADVTRLGVLRDGRVVVATTRPYAVTVYASDGAEQRRYDVQLNDVTMSADDTLAAWIGADFRVRVLESGHATPTTLPSVSPGGESPGAIDAVLGSDCAAGGCTVLAGDGTTTTTAATVDGATRLRTARPLRVIDVAPDGSSWSVQYPEDTEPQFGCAGLYDPDARRMTAHRCDLAGLLFSPDGEHLMGLAGDNNMADRVDVVDRDLRDAGSFRPGGPAQVVSRAAWADSGHLLVAVAGLQGDEWSLVRVDTSGSAAGTVDGPTPGRNPELVTEYRLSD
jgi:hypothetical protein